MMCFLVRMPTSFSQVAMSSPSTIGLKGSPTNIFKSFTPPQKGVGMMLEGSGKETCEELAAILTKKHII